MINNLVFDCDGTLTDGKYYYSKDGKELVTFHANDSMATMCAKNAGMRVIMISSGSYQEINKKRAEDLGIEHTYAPVGHKLEILEALGIDFDSTAYVGDCFDDVPIIEAVAYGFVPHDALPEVREKADYVLNRNGGCGCLLEAWLKISDYNERLSRQ